MNFSPYTNKPRKDCSSSSSFQEDALLSLLSRPLTSMEHSFPCSPPTSFTLPLSFEDPFEDPSMEPEPLLSPTHGSAPLVVPSMTDSIFGRDDGLSSPFLNHLHKEPTLTADSDDLCQSLLDILNPVIMDFAGSNNKRSCEALFEHHGPSRRATKRQRTSNPAEAPASTTEESTTARFRPYQEKQWQAQFDKLIQYKNKYGHCCVPHSYQEDLILARWVKRQRYQYKKFNDGDLTSTMTTRRIQELESAGFVWHSHHAGWQEKLNELKDFQQQTGHCNVPSHYPENVALTTWVKCQRRQYKLFIAGSSSHMTLGRFQVLESLGFVFDVRQTKSHQRASSLNRSVWGVSC